MKNSPSRIRGFSLLELIVVIMIIGIIAAFTIPAASTIIKGSQLTQASQIVIDQFSLARQYALTKNRSVEVRFIKYADKEMPGETDGSGNPDVNKGSYRAIQTMEVLESGVAVPLDKPQILPQSIIFNPGSLSSLIGGTGRQVRTPKAQVSSTDGTGGDPEMPRGVALNYQFVSFRFLPDGTTDLLPATTTWFVTIHNINEVSNGTTPPKNFFTLQIDPVSGITKKFRPSV